LISTGVDTMIVRRKICRRSVCFRHVVHIIAKKYVEKNKKNWYGTVCPIR